MLWIFCIIGTYIGALIITDISNRAAKILLRKKYNPKETAIRSFVYVGLVVLSVSSFIKSLTSFPGGILYALSDFIIYYFPCLLIYLRNDMKKIKNEKPTANGISLNDETKKCPDCGEIIKLEARKCRFCDHLFNEEDLRNQTGKRKAEIIENEMSMKGLTRCPKCGWGSVYKDYMQDGSIVDWCPHCEEPIQSMRK